ncbi:MAG: hypothetical protein HW421_2938 [Ignavibacteria bacterium]|nr:hypothetical protein [Ignavibacteria bacterium]
MQDTLPIDTQHVEERVRDWKKRVSDLYSIIEEWLRNSEYSLKYGPKLIMYEGLMSQFNVHSTEVETADIYKNNKIVLTIQPKGLWVIGANGRVDILSTEGNHLLLDVSEQFETPHWKLFNGNKKNGIDFTKQSFLQILSK